MQFVPLERLLLTEGLFPQEQLFAQNPQFESALNLVGLRCFFSISLKCVQQVGRVIHFDGRRSTDGHVWKSLG